MRGGVLVYWLCRTLIVVMSIEVEEDWFDLYDEEGEEVHPRDEVTVGGLGSPSAWAGEEPTCPAASSFPFNQPPQGPLALDIEADGECPTWIDRNRNRGMKPNYFVAVQITDSEIHAGLSAVHQHVVSVDPRMKAVMTDLATLHLTLMVTYLHDQDDVIRASDALTECGHVLRSRFKDKLPVLELVGLGTFRDKVVFATIKPGETLNQVHYVHNCIKKTMAKHGIFSTDSKKFSPHITVMNMNDVDYHFKKAVGRSIKWELYSRFRDSQFGRQPLSAIQLCAMGVPKDGPGYYPVLHTVKLDTDDVDDS